MKLLFKKIVVFASLLAAGAFGIFCLADGNSDPFYLRFTGEKQSSLILGTSKAAQGLQPNIINGILGRKDIYNYAFTVAHSPYGPTYLKSIKNKIDTTKGPGIFIVTVDPYSVSSRNSEPNDISNFRENRFALGQVEEVNSNPNIEYLLFHYPFQYIYIITKKLNYVSNERLHEDGWYEVNISMKKDYIEDRISRKIISEKEKLKEYRFSDARFFYLKKTVDFLKKHGEVYLVRLPVSQPFLELEKKLIPNFNKKIKNLSKEFKIPFLDLNETTVNYDYTDGNHLYKDSGRIVSQKIAVWIQNHEK